MSLQDYVDAGFKLCAIYPNSKKPVGNDWPKLPKSLKFWEQNPEFGVGLIHAQSGTCSIDIDDLEQARVEFKARGLDLDAMLADPNNVQIKSGRPNRAKLLYWLPEGYNLQKISLGYVEFRCGEHQDALPPTIHPDTKKPYELCSDLDSMGYLPDLLLDWWLQITKPAVTEITPVNYDLTSPIGRFNATHSVGDILAKHGYADHGNGRWLAPSSTTGIAGVVLLDTGKVYSHHSDKIGLTGHAHDAYSLHCLFDDKTETDFQDAAQELVEQEKILENMRDETLAKHTAELLSPNRDRMMLIYDMERFFVYDTRSKIWATLDDSAIRRGAAMLDGKQGIKDDGSVGTVHMSKKKQCDILAILKDSQRPPRLIERGGERDRPFGESRPGVLVNDMFLKPDLDARLIIEEQAGPAHYARFKLSCDIDSQTTYEEAIASAPRFAQFLEDIFPGEEDKKRLVLEHAGVAIFGVSTSFQKLLIMLDGTGGDGANGKSVLLKVMHRLLPQHMLANIPPDRLSGPAARFETSQLFGVRLNFITEAKEREIMSGDTLKALTTGDPIRAEQKYRDPFYFRPTSGHIFAMNNLPPVREVDNAFFRRFDIVDFNQRFTGKRAIKNLEDILWRNESEAITRVILAAGMGAIKRGHYTQTNTSAELVDDWRGDANPVLEFANDVLIQDGAAMLSAKDMYAIWEVWRDENGFMKLSSTTFGKRLKSIISTKRTMHGVQYLAKLNGTEQTDRLSRLAGLEFL